MATEPVDDLVTRVEGATLILELSRPEALNALSGRLLSALTAAIQAFEKNGDLRVLILSGAPGRAFCVGGDLKEIAESPGAGARRPDGSEVFSVLAACPKPTIAAIHGFCLGGGFELALTCDLRVAARDASFALPEPRVGMIASVGLDELCRVIPIGEALRIQLTGARMSAERAYQIGLVQDIANDRAEMLDRAAALARDIALCAPNAVRTIKHVVRTGRDLPIGEARKLSAPYRSAARTSAEALEGVRAFREKRRPNWARS